MPELIAAGWSFDEIVANYPGLTVEDIRACVAYAKDVLAEERVFPAANVVLKGLPTNTGRIASVTESDHRGPDNSEAQRACAPRGLLKFELG